jgi:integrase
MEGKPNPSGDPEDEGDKDFERSRDKAKNKLESLKIEARADGQTAHLTQRLVEIKTGRKFKVMPIKELPAIAQTLKTKRGRSEDWRKWQVSIIKRFTEWAVAQGLRNCIEVTPEIAQDYFSQLDDGAKTVETLKHTKGAFSIVFSKALPEGVKNPFHTVNIENSFDGRGETENRTPLTEEQENLLLETARKNDPFIYQLIVCALSTGLRRGDVCRLKWESVDFRAEQLNVRTSKTGEKVNIPIMPTLKEVLETQLAQKEDEAEYVFPEAKRLIDSAPDRITYRVKRAFAQVFIDAAKNEPEEAQDKPEPVTLAKVLPEVLNAVQRLKIGDSKRAKLIDVLNLYASGKSYREIQKTWKISRGAISSLLHLAQKESGLNFMPVQKVGVSISSVISNVTRKDRYGGSRKASKYDFHALRTTFCTRWLAKGKDIGQLGKITGHKKAELVQKTYFKSKGGDFKDELKNVMSSGLLGSTTPKALPAASGDRLQMITQQLAELNEERKQLKKMLNRKAVK